MSIEDKEKYKEAKGVYQEVKNLQIKYGMVSKITGRIITDKKEINEKMETEYQLQTPEKVMQSKVAICWDMAELLRSRLKKASFLNKTVMIVCMSKGSTRLTHTTNLFKIGSEYYWMEGMDSPTLGVHKEPYHSLQEFSKALINEFKEKSYDTYYTFLYSQPRYGLGAKEYLDFVTNQSQIEKVSSLHESTMYEGINLV